MAENKTRVLMIGLDGATFDLIYPWVEQGKLPNFKRFMDQGVHGSLTSVIRPASPQAWSSFITGKNPGKHRINYFIERIPNSYDVRFVNAKRRVGESIWGALSRHGKRVGIINVPMTYPPEKVNGFMISGMDSPGADRNSTYPAGLHLEIKEKVGKYILDSGMGGYVSAGRHISALKRLNEMIHRRLETARYLYHKEKWDFFMVVFVAPDRVQHSFWRYMDPKHPLFTEDGHEAFGKAIENTYVKMDEILGEFDKMVDGHTVTLVMSDHGAGPVSDKTIYLNKWLASKGLLRFKDAGHANTLGGKSRLGFRRHLRRVLRRGRSFLWKRTRRETKEKLLKLFPGLRDKMMSMFFFSAIDMENTRVYAEENRSIIWLNVKGRDPKGIVEPHREYEELRDYVVQELESLRCPYTGQNVVERAYKRDELYSGPYVNEAPDIMVMWNDYTSRPSDTAKSGEFIRRISKEEQEELETNLHQNAEHRLNGIFMAKGPHVKCGMKLNRAHIMDLAPTILHLFGLPVPEDIDGNVLSDMFEDGFLRHRPVEYDNALRDEGVGFVSNGAYSIEDSEQIRDRLRDLGYIE